MADKRIKTGEDNVIYLVASGDLRLSGSSLFIFVTVADAGDSLKINPQIST